MPCSLAKNTNIHYPVSAAKRRVFSESFIVLATLRWYSIMSLLLISGKNTSTDGNGKIISIGFSGTESSQLISNTGNNFWCTVFSSCTGEKAWAEVFCIYCACTSQKAQTMQLTHARITELKYKNQTSCLLKNSCLKCWYDYVSNSLYICLLRGSNIWSCVFSRAYHLWGVT